MLHFDFHLDNFLLSDSEMCLPLKKLYYIPMTLYILRTDTVVFISQELSSLVPSNSQRGRTPPVHVVITSVQRFLM